MSILQSKQKNLRFLKRQNLEEEARLIGTWYSDLISQYGLDCIYYKLDTSVFGNYKDIVDRNAILQQAYGYNLNPSYSCSAEMVTYPEMQSDIFQLNKYGIVPQAEIDFHFDSKQFACDLATQCGQLKEFKIQESEIICQVPECTSEKQKIVNPFTKEEKEIYLSSNMFPYSLGLGYKENFQCDILSGKLSVQIDGYEYGKEYTIVCHPFDLSRPHISFNKDDDLYKSLEYEIDGEEDFDTMIYLKFRVDRTAADADHLTGDKRYESILSGRIFGGVLFYDINEIGKYIELIHPEVGDIVAIDFPDENNREQYEITDCYNKSLQSDGISPLLHKYIWKCKAKRHIDSYDQDDIKQNDDDMRLEEKIKYEQAVTEQVVEKISKYDEGDQEAYGGYDSVQEKYDHMVPEPSTTMHYTYTEEGDLLDIMRFDIGARLATNGYDLIFIEKDEDGIPGNQFVVSKNSHEQVIRDAFFESGLRWLKATDDKIVFINIEGEANSLVEDELATEYQFQLCLNDLNEKTLDTKPEVQTGNFIRFKGTRTYLWTDGHHLFANLQSNKDQLYKLI